MSNKILSSIEDRTSDKALKAAESIMVVSQSFAECEKLTINETLTASALSYASLAFGVINSVEADCPGKLRLLNQARALIKKQLDHCEELIMLRYEKEEQS